jgi:diaminopimelate decarboxylase
MKKAPFITKEQAEEIAQKFPTPFHIYDEKVSERMPVLLKKLLHGIRGSRNILL